MVKLKYIGTTKEWFPTCNDLTVDKGWIGEIDDKTAKKLLGTKKFKVVKQKREDHHDN